MAENALGIKLSIKAFTIDDLKTAVKRLDGSSGKPKLHLDVVLNTKGIADQVKKIEQQLANSNINLNVDIDGITNSKKGAKNSNATVDGAQLAAREKQIENLETAYSRLNKQKELYDEKYTGLNLGDFRSAIDELEKLKTNTEGFQEALAKAGKEAAIASNSLNEINQQELFDKRRQSELTQLENGFTRITKMLEGNSRLANSDIGGSMKQLADQAKDGTISIGDFQQQLANYTKDAQEAGLTTQTLGDRLKKLFGEHLTTAVAMAGIHFLQDALRQVYENVVEVDTALTELKKVTDETDATYARFLNTASGRAESLGATLGDVVNATADFARLGNSMSDASILADAAIVYKNVGDGIDDVSEASESIISTMKAFGIEAEDAMGIVDRFNEVGNNFAISSEGVGEALKRSAAALAQAGSTIDESIGLIVAGNAVVQDPEVVGTALKTMSLRLTKTKTELEELGEEAEYAATTTSEYRDSLLALTHGQVDILNAAGDAYKAPYQIMQDMAAAFTTMTQMEQQAALYLMGGTRQANTLSSILLNMDTAAQAVTKSLDSAGSAMAENDKYLDSINGKIAQFQAAFQALSTSLLSSDLVKGFVGMGTGVVEVLDAIISKVGTLPVVVSSLLTAFSIGGKSSGKVNMPAYASCELLAA